MTDLARIVIEATDNTQAGIASANRGLASLMQQAVASRGALALLGGAGIVGGLAMITQQGLEAADSAGKLAQKMGTTVEEASALSYAAKLSAVDTGTLAKGMKGLSEKLVEASDGASDTARLFKLMGVDIKGGTVPALEQVADYFAQLPDGATKTALAVKVLGKSGQEMIPFLNEGGAGIRRMKEEAKDLGLVIDGETAAAAQKFNDNLAAMKTGAEALAITLATKMAGALGNISEAMKAAYLDGGKLMALWVGLGGAADHIFGSAGLSETQRIAKEMNEIQDRMRQSGQRLQDAGDLIGKNGETTRAAIMAGIQKDFNQLKALNDQLIAIKKGEQAKATEQAEAERRKKENEEKVKAELASAEARKKAAADAAKAEAELNNLLSGISNKAAGMDADMDKKAGILFKAFASGRISLVQYSMAMTDLIQQQQFYKTALVDIAKNEEHRLKLLKEMREEEVAGINARDELLDSLEDEIKALQIETRTMGATSAERERQLDVLRMERDIKKALSAEDEERIRKLYAERGALRQARDAAKENVDAFRDTFGEMDRFASDAFANILQGGRDTFTRLADTIKTTALSALYQMTVRPWIVQFAASLTGTSSSQAAALMGNSGGGSGIGNLLGNLLGTGSGGTSAIGSAIGSAIFGNAAAYAAAVPGLTVGGTQAAMLAAQTGSFGAAGLASTAAAGGSAAGGTGILSSLGSSLSALGPYAAAAAAISAIYNAVKKPGGPKEGGGAILEYGATGNLIRTGDGGSVFGVSSQNSQFSELGSGMAATFFEKLKQLGGTVSSAGFTIGSDQDPRGTAQNRIKNFVDINGRRVYSVMDRGVGRDAGELQKQLQLESKRAILAALQASDLPANMAAILDDISAESASEQDIDNLLARASAMQQLFGSFGDAIDFQFNAPVKTAIDLLYEQGEALSELARLSDNSAESIGNVATATAQYRASVTQLIAQYQEAKGAIGETIDAAIRGFKFDTLDKQGQYEFLQDEANNLAALIGSTSDAGALADLVRNITQASTQAFGLLDDPTKLAKRDEFIAGLEDVRGAANQRIIDLQQQAADAANKQLEDTRKMFEAVTAQQAAAASTLVTAANTFAGAVGAIAGGGSTGYDNNPRLPVEQYGP